MKINMVSRSKTLDLLKHEIDKVGVPAYVDNRNGGITEGLNRAYRIVRDSQTSSNVQVNQEQIDKIINWFYENSACENCILKDFDKCDSYGACREQWVKTISQIVEFGYLL